MKTKKILAMVCLGVAFTACSNEEEEQMSAPIGETANLVIDLGGFKTTRGIDDPYEQEKETFATLQIMIVDNAGTIMRSDYIASGLADVSEYTKIYGTIKATSSDVYVVANLKEKIAVTETTTLTEVKAAVYEALNQQVSGKIIMDGIGKIDKQILITVGEDTPKDGDYDDKLNTYGAAVEISPIVARMQIKTIVKKADSKVTSFNVAGIYMNKTYKEMALNLTGSDLISYGSVGDDYTDANFGVFAIEDDFVNGAFPAGKCAAFNYFAEACTGALAKAAPHILIKLTNIKYAEGYNGLTEGWLTIQRYDTDPVNRNTIYTIDKVEFDESNIGPNPYQTTANIQVSVTVKPWTKTTLIPSLD